MKAEYTTPKKNRLGRQERGFQIEQIIRCHKQSSKAKGQGRIAYNI